MSVRIDDEAVITRSPSVLWNTVDGAIVLMDIDSGAYYDLDASGAAIWSLLEAPATMRAICESLQDRYTVDNETCRTDVSLFLNDICGKGLVKIKGVRDDQAG